MEKIMFGQNKFIVKMSGSEYRFSAKVLLEDGHRDLSYKFTDTINAYRKLVQLKYGSKNNLENRAMLSLSNFTDSLKIDSLFKIFQIYREINIRARDGSEAFLVDFCKIKLERLNSSFSVTESHLDSYLYPYDEIKIFLDKVVCDCDNSGFDDFLKNFNTELNQKVKHMQEWMKEDSVASRYEKLIEELLSFEKIKDVLGNSKTFWKRLELECGRDFAENVREDVLNAVSKKLVFVLISQKVGFLDALCNFEEIGKITRWYIKPEHVLSLHDSDKQKISIFL